MQKYRIKPNVVPLNVYDIKVGKPEATMMYLWMLGLKTLLVAKYAMRGIMPVINEVNNFIVTFDERPVTVESEPMNMCMPGKS
jgi:hypothetical protein